MAEAEGTELLVCLDAAWKVCVFIHELIMHAHSTRVVSVAAVCSNRNTQTHLSARRACRLWMWLPTQMCFYKQTRTCPGTCSKVCACCAVLHSFIYTDLHYPVAVHIHTHTHTCMLRKHRRCPLHRARRPHSASALRLLDLEVPTLSVCVLRWAWQQLTQRRHTQEAEGHSQPPVLVEGWFVLTLLLSYLVS